MADKIVGLMPAHLHYVEPFAGGLSVLLAKEYEGVSEVANDKNRALTNFWNVLKHSHTFEAFRRVMEATPFSEVEWEVAEGLLRDLGWHVVPTEGDIPERSTAACVLRACHFFVACRQSLAGRMDGFATLSRNRTRRGMNEQASAWLSAVEGLSAVHERLKRVVVLNRDALLVIGQQDGPNTLYYCDPPFLPETRACPDVYEHEMSRDQHEDLLRVLAGIEGRFMLSGYANDLYDAYADRYGWRRHDFEVPNSAAGGKKKRTMVASLWCNF
jgi:DNA adenine methylase